MVIRKATRADAHDLKVLYFEYLTNFLPKEEQDMNLWGNLLEKFNKDEKSRKNIDVIKCFLRQALIKKAH